MLKWAQNHVRKKTFSNRVNAKVEFRCCMDRLTRDLKLYRIPPKELVTVRSTLIGVFVPKREQKPIIYKN
jgi:hypothetical protein